MSDDPLITRQTVILEKGISLCSPTMKALTDAIQRGISLGYFRSCDPELTAQVFWSAMYGLTFKLISEKDLPAEQVDRLIHCQFELLLNGLMERGDNE